MSQVGQTSEDVFMLIDPIALTLHSCVLFSCSVYFESVTWDELVVGFQQPPGGPTYANRSVLSYHFYIPPQV